MGQPLIIGPRHRAFVADFQLHHGRQRYYTREYPEVTTYTRPRRHSGNSLAMMVCPKFQSLNFRPLVAFVLLRQSLSPIGHI